MKYTFLFFSFILLLMTGCSKNQNNFKEFKQENLNYYYSIVRPKLIFNDYDKEILLNILKERNTTLFKTIKDKNYYVYKPNNEISVQQSEGLFYKSIDNFFYYKNEDIKKNIIYGVKDYQIKPIDTFYLRKYYNEKYECDFNKELNKSLLKNIENITSLIYFDGSFESRNIDNTLKKLFVDNNFLRKYMSEFDYTFVYFNYYPKGYFNCK